MTSGQLSRSGKLDDDGIAVTVNAVTPGHVGTEMVAAIPEILNRIKTEIPVGRLGHPDEIARVVHFLAADTAGCITGQVWGVNGGLDL